VVEAVSVIEVGVPALTVTVVVGVLTVPEAALIVVVQMPVMVFTGVTRPVELIVAQAVVLELQLTFPVKFCVEPSLNVPVAAICNVWEVVMVWSCGPIAIEESVGFTKKPVHPVAMAKSKKAQPAAISEYLRSKFRINEDPATKGVSNPFHPTAHKNCSRETRQEIGHCTNVCHTLLERRTASRPTLAEGISRHFRSIQPFLAVPRRGLGQDRMFLDRNVFPHFYPRRSARSVTGS